VTSPIPHSRPGGPVTNRSLACTLLVPAALTFPSTASARQEPVTLSAQRTNAQESNLPAAAQGAEGAVERAGDRFRIGIVGGVAIDPEMIVFGAHGAFGPISLPAWSSGPVSSSDISHVSFGTDDADSVDASGTTTRNRFDFSNTSVEGGPPSSQARAPRAAPSSSCGRPLVGRVLHGSLLGVIASAPERRVAHA
jgi:hypothetical protein